MNFFPSFSSMGEEDEENKNKREKNTGKEEIELFVFPEGSFDRLLRKCRVRGGKKKATGQKSIENEKENERKRDEKSETNQKEIRLGVGDERETRRLFPPLIFKPPHLNNFLSFSIEPSPTEYAFLFICSR